MAKKKEMSRTAGTAKRKISQAEEVRFGMKTGKPLTGSASGVKSISLKQAGEALTQGIVTTRGGKLQFAPEGLAMALPLGKVAKAAKALRAIGGARNRSVAASLTERLRSKAAGKSFGQSLAENKAAGGGPILQYIANAGAGARKASESVFPRAPKKGFLGDLEAGALPGSNMTNAQARRLAASRAADRAGNYTPVRELEKRLSLPAAGSVEMVKKTAKQFGQKVSGKEAKNISRLLRGRDR
jgi:hypothetical protein